MDIPLKPDIEGPVGYFPMNELMNGLPLFAGENILCPYFIQHKTELFLPLLSMGPCLSLVLFPDDQVGQLMDQCHEEGLGFLLRGMVSATRCSSSHPTIISRLGSGRRSARIVRCRVSILGRIICWGDGKMGPARAVAVSLLPGLLVGRPACCTGRQEERC